MILTALLPSWKLALDAADKSPKTIISYLDSVKRLEAYLAAEALPLEAPSIRSFLAGERDQTSPASAAKHYRNLCVYFRWLLAEDEIKDNPMVRVEKPKVAEEAKPFFTGAELAALLKVTRGPDFEARRDHAITRILIDTGHVGPLISGTCGVRLDVLLEMLALASASGDDSVPASDAPAKPSLSRLGREVAPYGLPSLGSRASKAMHQPARQSKPTRSPKNSKRRILPATLLADLGLCRSAQRFRWLD